MKVLNEVPCKYTTEFRILHIEVKSNSSEHTNVESKQNLVWSSDFYSNIDEISNHEWKTSRITCCW